MTDHDLQFSIDRIEFGPFEDYHDCMHEYGGIGETCSNEATHVIVFEEEDGEFHWFKCDEHTFPFIREERRAKELGYPPKCQICRHMGRPSALKNETEGYGHVTMDDGSTEDYYLCEECSDSIGVSLHPIEEGPDMDDVTSIDIP